MDTGLVNPFIDSVCGLFAKLLDMKVKQGDLSIRQGYNNPNDLMAMVGLGTPARGTVTLSFPQETACAVVSRLIDTRLEDVDETVVDGLAELVNIVAGSAKEKLVPPDMPPVELSLPTVVRGRKEILESTGQAPWLDVTFTSELGPFSLALTFDADAGTKVSQIDPFINSVHEFCTTMLQLPVEHGSVVVRAKAGNQGDLMAFVGLSGPVRGTAMLAFPVETAMALVGRMLGITIEDVDENVVDGLAEMINIVAGGAKKALLETNDIPVELSIPSVIQGKTQRIDCPQSVWMEVMFGSDLGPFTLRLNFAPPEEQK